MAIKLALDEGNKISEKTEGWTKVKEVISMEKKLNADLKDKIENKIKKLRYWKYEGSPHNEPDEGFSCDQCQVVLSFPLARKIIR